MLTEIACKSTTCPPDKPRARFADAGGLYLEVTPTVPSAGFGSTVPSARKSALRLATIPKSR
ncbi:Arm DNA-binding domain-containing protein [Diaphorobacter sp. LR2014-1]|uniref:Arm DNA-binding domain-containing protein n=1 Tax=Diaphorobacter sp. LR2014-1 TaxID=1933219 RepID=UPI001FF081EA|nr:Arm DNA-binding domain-containing protein [Diaphorobacter sp. LR2014-1]